MSSPPPEFVRHAEHFAVERRKGVLLLRMHTGGGPAVMSLGLHRALGEVLQEAGADPDNEVLILTGTGDAWIGGLDPALRDRPPTLPGEARYDLYRDGDAVAGYDFANGEGRHADVDALRKEHPGLMDFATWLHREGAAAYTAFRS